MKLNPGLEPSSSEAECRKKDRLDYCNTYARERCNNGWCVYMYGYYAEMDWSVWSSHRHDWEHAMVWTRGGDVWSVMWSAHGSCNFSPSHFTSHILTIQSDSDADPRDVLWQGSHPKLVAHHSTGGTSSLRRAKSSDDVAENHYGEWFACPLQQFEHVDPVVWKTLLDKDWGEAHMDLYPGRYEEMLNKYMPKQAKADGFKARDDEL